jgi:hypothetical protein
MSDVEALRGPLTNFFVSFQCGAASRRDAIALENKHAATEQVDLRMLRQVFRLTLETLGISNVIGVHAREIFPTAHRNGLVQARHQTFVRMIRKHRNARIGKTPRHFQSPVARAVFHQQQFPIAVGLIQDRTDRNRERFLAIESGHPNRNERGGLELTVDSSRFFVVRQPGHRVKLTSKVAGLFKEFQSRPSDNEDRFDAFSHT